MNLDLNKQNETDIQNQESKYLFELVADGSLVINDYIKRKEKFTDPLLLTDLFINEMFQIDALKEYFEEDAWKAVLYVYNCKVKLRMCKCNQICSSKFISCSKCKQSYHHECKTLRITLEIIKIIGSVLILGNVKIGYHLNHHHHHHHHH